MRAYTLQPTSACKQERQGSGHHKSNNCNIIYGTALQFFLWICFFTQSVQFHEKNSINLLGLLWCSSSCKIFKHGQCLSTKALRQLSFGISRICFVIFTAPDSTARLPDEDPSQLPPHEEDGQRQQHACEELRTETFPSTCTCVTLLSL